jgi:hypothetical protein
VEEERIEGRRGQRKDEEWRRKGFREGEDKERERSRKRKGLREGENKERVRSG